MQRYSFRCDVRGCDTEEEQVTPLAAYQPIDAWPPKPTLPPGWHRVDDGIICPLHATVDVQAFVS